MKRLLTVHGSSNVKMIGYDQATRELDVVYHATPDIVYRFQDITAQAFCGVIAADSVGTALAVAVKLKAHRKHGLPESGDHDTPASVKSGPVEVTVPRHIAQTTRGPLPQKPQPPPMTDQEAFDAVTNRPKKL